MNRNSLHFLGPKYNECFFVNVVNHISLSQNDLETFVTLELAFGVEPIIPGIRMNFESAVKKPSISPNRRNKIKRIKRELKVKFNDYRYSDSVSAFVVDI